MTEVSGTRPQAAAGSCPFSGAPTGTIVRVGTQRDLRVVMRSKAVEESADCSADNFLNPGEAEEINAREFLGQMLTVTNGDEHRRRRKLLNSLVRPEELVKFRETVTLPAVDRWLRRAVTQGPDGLYRCDLAAAMERIFIEFAAKIVGIQGVETEERMARLRSCALPIFAAMSARHFENRPAVIEAGIAAKKIFVDEFYTPSYEACQESLAKLAAGELDEDDVPMSLMRFIVSKADPSYLDENTAINDAVLFFVATTGTSVQAVLSTVDDLTQWFRQHPEDEPLAFDLEFISGALQESLRLRAPYTPFIARLAVDDFEVDGVKITAGDEVHCLIPRADRDASMFGDDAVEFNPRRVVPDGITPYGLAFGTGSHQCLGLRSVLGNDGKSGSHLRIIQRLFRAGVRPDPDQVSEVLPMEQAGDEIDEITTYITFPVVFTQWENL